ERVRAEGASIRPEDGDGVGDGVDRSPQLFVDGGQPTGPLGDSSIELLGHPLLLAQQPRLLEPDRRLIRRDPEQKALDLIREIESLRAGDDDADLVLKTQT